MRFPAFFVLNGDGYDDGSRRIGILLGEEKKNQRVFDKGLGYKPARLSISDFDNFSPRFYRTGRSSSCWTRVTGKDFRNFGSRQMKKLFYIHRQIAFSDQ